MPKKSQDFVNIKEVRDGIIIMKDNSLRGILMTTSVNLALKSVDEQEAILMQFQNFLNTIEFPVQIVVQSRFLDMEPYLATLAENLERQTEELLRVQTREYIEYIRLFSDQVNIMKKNFFVVVPYEGAIMDASSSKSFISDMLPNKSTQPVSGGLTEEFNQKRTQLEQRMGIVESGLTRFGVRVAPLSTDQILELFHNAHNPGISEHNLELPASV